MTFKISVSPEEHETLNAILMDIITSASFFERKNIEVEQEGNGLSFMFHGYCPNEYLNYLNWKYDLALECI